MNKTDQKIIIFTDGASRGNPGPGGWGAVVVLKDSDEVAELGGREDKTTNNRMELTAAFSSLDFLKDKVGEKSLVEIHTDSQYLINGITKWVFAWQQNGWQTKNKTEVLNKDLWQKILSVVQSYNIDWQYVAGHCGAVGNERADDIATSFADKIQGNLFVGSLKNYPHSILDTKVKNTKTKSSSSKGKAYSYVSLVNGKIETHQTWADCEKRVKGQKAFFRKALSPTNEEEIKKEFQEKI